MTYPDPVQPYPGNEFRVDPRPPRKRRRKPAGHPGVGLPIAIVVLAVALGGLFASCDTSVPPDEDTTQVHPEEVSR